VNGTDSDDDLMRRALAQAATARSRTAPNPWVGCVIVRDGEVVGEGATRPPGGPHAEVEALRGAGDRARGATAYVTLEPCAHHGRTPPCTDALVAAGIARVVVALEDPDPAVSGRGVAALRERGVTVDVGIGAALARASLVPYLVHRREGRSFVLLKTAMTLDGRVAAADGTSQWITGPESRHDVHVVRSKSQAVVVGAGTALADQPRLTARDVDPPPPGQPLRVLLDARGRVPATGPLFDTDLAPTAVITTAAAPDDATRAWLAAGAKVFTVPPSATGTGVDPLATFATLGGLGVLQAMVEGGPRLAGALLDAGVVDRIVAYVGPMLLGPTALPAFPIAPVPTLPAARRFALVDATRLGDDVRLTYEPATYEPAPPPGPTEPERA
jgi:diaminohydroxyphosphoribosylaminopyrimidine deaminase/5-amino-6-(5-phosphoribosylamino)uracil reductase